jgi:tRNA(adenine34) deaminase
MLIKTPKTEVAIQADGGSSAKAVDALMMARCIALSRTAADAGEYPFAAVIALDGQVVAEAINRTVRDSDVSRHAEVIALSQAQKALTREQLQRSTLYTNVEPCAMCAFCIREIGIGRVVYAISSPVMGGLSRWNILRDEGLSDRMPQVFSCVPEVVSGVMMPEAGQAWHDWYPFGWQMIRFLGLLKEAGSEGHPIEVQPRGGSSLWRYFRSFWPSSRSRSRSDARPQ